MNVSHFLQVQSCSAMQWQKCAGVVGQCAAQCAQSVSSHTCIACMGASYNQCNGCSSVIKEIQQHGKVQSSFMHDCVCVKWVHEQSTNGISLKK